MYQETVLKRVDVGNAATMDLVVERRRRDDSQSFVQRRKTGADFVRLRQGEFLPRDLLEARAFAVGSDGVAEDLRRFQNGEPILCRPTTSLERAVKWTRRKPAQAALLVMCMLAVLGCALLLFNRAVQFNL